MNTKTIMDLFNIKREALINELLEKNFSLTGEKYDLLEWLLRWNDIKVTKNFDISNLYIESNDLDKKDIESIVKYINEYINDSTLDELVMETLLNDSENYFIVTYEGYDYSDYDAYVDWQIDYAKECSMGLWD